MAAKKKRRSRKKKAAGSKKPTPAFAFIEAQLRKNRNATYAEIRDAAAAP